LLSLALFEAQAPTIADSTATASTFNDLFMIFFLDYVC